MASIAKRPDGRYRARYRDAAGKEYAKHFDRKVDAQKWLDGETAKLVTGNWTDPRTARTTVSGWCDQWLAGYATRRPSTVRQARVYVTRIKAEFGTMPLPARPAVSGEGVDGQAARRGTVSRVRSRAAHQACPDHGRRGE